MRWMLAALAGLVLSGCASVAGTNPNGGVVENAWSSKEAVKRADAYCAGYKRDVDVSNYDALMGSMTFKCMAK